MAILTHCDACGADGTVTEREDYAMIQIGDKDTIVVAIPVMTCSKCTFEWYDDRGEDLIGQQVTEFLEWQNKGRLAPDNDDNFKPHLN
jgi:YgiT-type zinc finger domain-containing protein|tara:strand:- start:686 stop:949 length:264 start_codon:yes stop_codon:yes gene_type:complete